MYRMLMFSYLQAPAGLGDHSDLDGKCLLCGQLEHPGGPAGGSGAGWGSWSPAQRGSAPAASG